MASRESIFRTGDHGEIPVILSENGKKSKLVNSASKKRVADGMYGAVDVITTDSCQRILLQKCRSNGQKKRQSELPEKRL